jgi:hypothetical protein
LDTINFARWLRIGLGRPILYLRDSASHLYRDTILDACLHDTVYDRQCEGSRAPYLFDVITATGEPDYYRDHLIAASAPEVLDGNDGEQLVAILGQFAKGGDSEARTWLYKVFDANVATERPDGATEIVEVDGVAGLLAIVGRLSFDSDDDWEAYRFVCDAIERTGEAETWAALRDAATTDPALMDFFALAQRGRDRYESPALVDRGPVPRADYATLRADFLAAEPNALGQIRRWAITAPDDQLRLAAADVLTEDDPKRLEVYLSLFRKRLFPLEHARLLTLARNAERRIRGPARTILANLTHSDIRTLGLALLAEGDGDGARLLANNYQEGDFTLIERLLLTWSDRDELHSLGFGLRDMAEAHPVAAATAALLTLYEIDPCALCRHGVVALLRQIGSAPDWLEVEYEYDSYGRHDK